MLTAMKRSRKRPRLAVVITDLGTGGAEVLVARLLPRLRENFEASVYSLRSRGDLGAELESHGIPVNALGVRSARDLPMAMRRLVAKFRDDTPDIVQTHLYHADLLGGWAARQAKVPRIVWGVHNSGLGWNTMKPSTRAVIRACAWSSRRVPDQIVSCSQSGIRTHAAIGYQSDRFVFIPNGFDLQQFRFDYEAAFDVRREFEIPQGAPVIGMVARLDPQKDHATFVAMAARIHHQRPDVHFVLVGHGVNDPAGEVVRSINAAGIGAACRLPGRRTDVRRLMSAFDLLVSSSIAEAFPLVIGEAMATGIPCVVTDVGDSALIVGETGRVVQPRDPEALALASLDLLSMTPEARRARGAAARLRIAECFDLDRVAALYAKLYASEICRSASN
jgi:glycosyltransferase involved in cell wall biosynthesis